MKQPYEMETTAECNALMRELERALNAKVVELIGREVLVVILLSDPIPGVDESKSMAYTNMDRDSAVTLISQLNHIMKTRVERN